MVEKKIDNILFLNGKDGSRLTFKVLFTYYSENFKKDYAVFYNVDDDNHLLAFSFDENKTLSELETKEEYQELEKVLRSYDEENRN